MYDCADNQTDWAQFLPWVEYTQNSMIHSATKLTPFQLILGYQSPPFPWNANPTEVPAMDKWFCRSKEVWESTH